MQDYEKLGAFFLGKAHDEATDDLSDEIVLYDSKDLTTHAVIIGMTGSGKTGLGVGLIEEALIDKVPVIAIDPKGDMGNLLLTFPKLAAEDFEPWVDPGVAATNGQTPTEFAAGQAALWKKGLGQWGQDGKRIKTLKDTADFAIYTPGSEAGLPISVLKSFDAPDEALRNDGDLYREHIQATATGLLTLLGVDADPLTSREHILLSNILSHFWNQGQSLGIAEVIGAIQSPPIERVGVMDLESFYPAKDRFALAMRLNNLLAAPGFESWMQGESLDIAKLFHTAEGKPRCSIMSIAHLSDSQRMFFVTLLLSNLIAWMRAQPGTGSLRAILYMDELFGYMPPTANPPSKMLFLTLLKQARAFGLGLVLSTQNPVDLDYKGLSNTGTWFIGRLQTERDKARVMEGLEGAAGDFDKQAMEQTLAGLGKRRFLLHNVHESAPVVFGTRWVMSYLRGPLTRDQISMLMANKSTAAISAAEPSGTVKKAVKKATGESAKPVLPPKIKQHYLTAEGHHDPAAITYFPMLMGAAEVHYASTKYKVTADKNILVSCEIGDGPAPVDWDHAEPIAAKLTQLKKKGIAGTAHADLPAAAGVEKNYTTWQKDFSRWLRNDNPLSLYRSPNTKLVSTPDETEGAFRARIQQSLREARDIKIAALKQKYAKKVDTLEDRLSRARATLGKEVDEARAAKVNTAVSVGTAILGAFLGRKAISSTTARKVGTAMRGAGAARKQASDVDRAEAKVQQYEQQIAELDVKLQAEIEALEDSMDAANETLESIQIKPKSTDIQIRLVGLVWAPYIQSADGRLQTAWQTA